MIGLVLVLGFVAAAGWGVPPSPPPPAQTEFEQAHGADLAEARRLHAGGQVEEAAALLRRLLAASSWEVRARAISLVGELRERRLLPEIHRAVKDPMLFVRERATRVLQTIGDASSLEPLREALSEPDAAVRGNVAEALAKIGRAKELAALTRVLERDADEDVRARTAAALGQARVAGAVDPLVAALRDRSLSVRARAAESLGEIGDPRARRALERCAASDPESGVRASAEAALQRLHSAKGGAHNP